jgi:hypothetical protein
MHHIATVFEGEGKWASKFKDIFDRAGYSLEDDINKVMVEGHFGPHDEWYHQMIFDKLDQATANLSGSACRSAFEAKMMTLRSQVTDINHILNALITHG